MPWVTEEEIQAAKNMTAYEYLRTHQAQRLQKTRTRNEWQLTDHDSFKINELSSKWHWKSRDIGGVSALRFLIEVDGMKFTDAVKLLCEESPSLTDTTSGLDEVHDNAAGASLGTSVTLNVCSSPTCRVSSSTSNTIFSKTGISCSTDEQLPNTKTAAIEKKIANKIFFMIPYFYLSWNQN